MMNMRSSSERFSFGKNWSRFLAVLNEERIDEAEKSLKKMLHVEHLRGKSFLDIGSGSGLFSLAAARLGAEKIHSFDYDADSVACTRTLKQKIFPDASWSIEQGSALDREYLKKLGKFDVVYSWGVLHHTGAMWDALENTVPLIADNGQLFIAIYNDQGVISKIWRQIKKIYNMLPQWTRPLYAFLVWAPFEMLSMLQQMLSRHLPWHHWNEYKKKRGMSIVHDIVDWVGGYPFETATPEQIFRFYRDRRFSLEELTVKRGMGCNEFVFRKHTDAE